MEALVDVSQSATSQFENRLRGKRPQKYLSVIRVMGKFIKVRVFPNAKKNEIKELGDGFKVYLTVPPTEGKANKALIEILASYFNLKKSKLEIIKGAKARDKIIEIWPG